MSAIPPNTISSIISTAAQAAQNQSVRDRDETDQARANEVGRARAEQRAGAVSDTEEENEVGDNSSSVGGQGRDSGGESEPEPATDQNTDRGLHRDEDGQLHLDIQA